MEKLLMQRQINTLYHFTQAQNLFYILQYGLLPRTILEKKNINAQFNDNNRYDNCTNSISTSIEFPNYKLFYKFRNNNPNIDWVVLKLDAHIMCTLPCAYCWMNAGDASMYKTPIKERMGKDAFLELFKDHPNYPTRKELNIPCYYPTNPQAEVLVFETIPATYIKQVNFQNSTSYDKYRNIFSYFPYDIDLSIDNHLFSYRRDWNFW